MPELFTGDTGSFTNEDGATVIRKAGSRPVVARPTLEDYVRYTIEHQFTIPSGVQAANIVGAIVYLSIKDMFVDHVVLHTDTDAAPQYSVSTDGVPRFRLVKIKPGTTLAQVLTDIPITGTSADTSATVQDTDWAWIGDYVTAEGIAGTQVTFDLSSVSSITRELKAGERLAIIVENVSTASADSDQLTNAVGVMLGSTGPR